MSRWQVLVLLMIFLGLVSIPFFFWGSFYNVGGDDSRLYYVFPLEFLSRFSFQFVSDNQLGTIGNYFSQTYLAPFLGLVVLLRYLMPFVHTQHLFYGLTIGGSFICFFYFLNVLLKKNDWASFLSKSIVSIGYSCSVFTYFTLWSHQLLPIYLLFVFPLGLFLYIKAVREQQFVYVGLLSLVLFFFSPVAYALPWLLGAVIVVIPLLVWVYATHTKTFLRSAGLMVILVCLLNAHWLFHFLYAPYSSQGGVDLISQVVVAGHDTAVEQNVVAVSKHNDILFPFLNIYHQSIQQDFAWSTLEIFQRHYRPLLIPNALLLVVSICAFFYVKKKTHLSQVYLVSLSAWLISLYFFTVNIGSWGLSLFLFFTKVIPGFVMFRNMFDKFGFGVAFSFWFLLGVSVYIMTNAINTKKKAKAIILGMITVLVFFNSLPFMRGLLFTLPYGNMANTHNKLFEFHADGIKLMQTLSALDQPGRILWMPLNTANYVFIPDAVHPKYVYMGVSPVMALAGVPDYTGLLSFAPHHTTQLRALLLAGEYQEVGHILQQYPIEYIVYNHTISEDIAQSYLYSIHESGDFFEVQRTQEFQETFLGEKIADIGTSYSIYAMPAQYQSGAIFMTSTIDEVQDTANITSPDITFHKESAHRYSMTIQGLHDPSYLVFLDPYHEKWQLYTNSGGSGTFAVPTQEHKQVFGYANAWLLDPEQIVDVLPPDTYTKHEDGSLDINLTLFFYPHRYFVIALGVSGVSVVLTILAVSWYFWKKHIYTRKKTQS